MEYCENWEQIRKKFLEYWAMENHDRPLVSIRAPKDRQEKKAGKPPFFSERKMDGHGICIEKQQLGDA